MEWVNSIPLDSPLPLFFPHETQRTQRAQQPLSLTDLLGEVCVCTSSKYTYGLHCVSRQKHVNIELAVKHKVKQKRCTMCVNVYVCVCYSGYVCVTLQGFVIRSVLVSAMGKRD